MEYTCEHLSEVQPVTPSADGCEDCIKIGAWWNHLRLCMTCGHVGCCDDSPNRHASKHSHTAQHHIITSFEPGEDWGWCFVDEIVVDDDWQVNGSRFHSETANELRDQNYFKWRREHSQRA